MDGKREGQTITYYFAPRAVNGAIYVAAETYPYGVIPDICLTNNFSPIAKLKVTHNNYVFEASWYNYFPYVISIPASY